MKQYVDLVCDIMNNGEDRGDRTGTGTRSIFGVQKRYNLEEGFPIVTVKRTWFKGVVHELLWLISGNTNIKYLLDNDVHIWDEWADENGDLGPVYGSQWRKWVVEHDPDYADQRNATTIDQLKNAIDTIKNNPESRRIIVNAWNAGEVNNMALPPCHMFYQFYVSNGKLSCQMYQRSADVFLGVPFNIASYSLLTHMVAQVCGLGVGEFIHTIGDAHIYNNHFDQVREMIKRKTRPLPKLVLNSDIKDIDEFKYEDIKLEGYNPHATIKAEVSV